MTSTVTVILPCAGNGSRFDAAYPKELHSLSPGVAVIDKALAPVMTLAATCQSPLRIVVVIAPHKMATVAYLHRYHDRADIVFVYQTGIHGDDLGGAIEAALPLCLGTTVLHLPDMLIRDESDDSLVRLVDAAQSGGWAVSATRSTDLDFLRNEGALLLSPDGSQVIDAWEKPGTHPDRFNAAWASVAVTAKHRHELPKVVKALPPSPLIGAEVVLVQSFHNVNCAREGGFR